MVQPASGRAPPYDPLNPTYSSSAIDPFEAERQRQETERILKGVAGFVVAGAALIGFAKLLSRALR